MPSPKAIMGSLLLLCASLLLAELLLRFIPSPIQYPPFHEFDDPASLLGIEIVPSTRTIIHEPCLTAVNTSNDLGWRDRGRTRERIPGRTRIAALGDSFVEMSQVNDEETITRQLEDRLGIDRAEVLNFGLSSIGTVQEEILYERVVESFDPDIVLLFFYPNDVLDSSRELSAKAGPPRLTYRDAAGHLVSERKASAFFGLRKWLRTHSTLFRLTKAAHRLLRRAEEKGSVQGGARVLPFAYHVYEDPPSAEWQRAWEEVERALIRLQSEVEPKRKLFVVLVPDILQIAHDPRSLVRQEYGIDPPAAFNPLLPRDEILRIINTYTIPTIDLLPPFLEYRDTHHLQYPYFSFTCDGHWSVLGQRIAAEAITEVLRTAVPALKEVHLSLEGT